MTQDKPTNFFERQENARKNCRYQLMLFSGAVLVIIVVTTLALRFVWYLHLSSQAYTHTNSYTAQSYARKLAAFNLFDPGWFLLAAVVITSVILAASLFKMHTLKQGGGAVAEMLGARRISPRTTNSSERQLVNVVEEMAIAASIPVPKIYVLDTEYNINAFAAGLELTDAAVTVTQGCLDKLTRDELQGVIAHEFSHILNGDMRLNVQLIGILYGILFLGITGRKFLSVRQISFRSGLPLIIAGFFLSIIGYMGSFLGRIMQCAISRQQELLADASAVQFTRNPMGLAGALKKIGGSEFGSRIKSAEAEQASHLFFSESSPALFDTHPPLIDRIRLLDPSFDGKFISIQDDRQKAKAQYTSPYWGTSKAQVPSSALASGRSAAVIDSIGSPSAHHLEQSHAILTAIPDDLHQAVQTPQGAACIIYALLMGEDTSRRDLQTAALGRALVLKGDVDVVLKWTSRLAGLPKEHKLPMLELAMPALSDLTSMEKRNFLLIMEGLISADGKISLLELSFQWILEKYLTPSEGVFGSITTFSYSQIGLDIAVLLQALACAGQTCDAEKARKAFDAGIARIPELAARRPDFRFEANTTFVKVNRALKDLSSASFKIRQTVLEACVHCALADQNVTFEESELLRVVALALQCPLPPLALNAEQETTLPA